MSNTTDVIVKCPFLRRSRRLVFGRRTPEPGPCITKELGDLCAPLRTLRPRPGSRG